MLFVEWLESEMRMWSIFFVYMRTVLFFLPITAVLMRLKCDFE